jgi:hypothetical protein
MHNKMRHSIPLYAKLASLPTNRVQGLTTTLPKGNLKRRWFNKDWSDQPVQPIKRTHHTNRHRKSSTIAGVHNIPWLESEIPRLRH